MGLVAETKRVGNIRHGIAFTDHRNGMRPKRRIAHVLERGALVVQVSLERARREAQPARGAVEAWTLVA
jgi:hypothetical protein